MISEQQIRDMEPGRELDKLVDGIMRSKEDTELLNSMTWYMPEGEVERTYPPYSSDISAAIEMLEKFDSYQCTKMHNVLAEKETKYRVIVAANKNAAYGDTLPLAACRAALIAILRGGSGE